MYYMSVAQPTLTVTGTTASNLRAKNLLEVFADELHGFTQLFVTSLTDIVSEFSDAESEKIYFCDVPYIVDYGGCDLSPRRMRSQSTISCSELRTLFRVKSGT